MSDIIDQGLGAGTEVVQGLSEFGSPGFAFLRDLLWPERPRGFQPERPGWHALAFLTGPLIIISTAATGDIMSAGASGDTMTNGASGDSVSEGGGDG